MEIERAQYDHQIKTETLVKETHRRGYWQTNVWSYRPSEKLYNTREAFVMVIKWNPLNNDSSIYEKKQRKCILKQNTINLSFGMDYYPGLLDFQTQLFQYGGQHSKS